MAGSGVYPAGEPGRETPTSTGDGMNGKRQADVPVPGWSWWLAGLIVGFGLGLGVAAAVLS